MTSGSCAGDLKHGVGYLGSALLFIGLFLPSVAVPSVGSVNYFWNGGAAVLLLLLIVSSVVALFTGRWWALWLTGAAALTSIAATLGRAVFRAAAPLAAGAAPAPSSLGDGLASGPGGFLFAAVQLQWGWPVLVVGALLLIGSADIGRREGIATPGFFRDAALATAVLIAMIVLGPPVLSRTLKAFTEFHAIERQQERQRWEPHESARHEMATVIAHVRDEELERLVLAEEARVAQARERDREGGSAVRVQLVSDVRRWYPSFADSLRPVLEARDALAAEHRAKGLAGARDSCRSLAETIRGAAERYPRSPDAELHGVMTRLLDLHRAFAGGCQQPPPAGVAPGDFEHSERELEALLDALAAELAGYCLELPGRRPAATPQMDLAMHAGAPRDRGPLDLAMLLGLR